MKTARELSLCHCEERQRPCLSAGREAIFKKIASQKALAMTRFSAMLAMTSLIFFSLAAQAQTPPTPSDKDWYTAGANYQRTSWVSEEVKAVRNADGSVSNIRPEWYKKIDPYVPQKVQVIAANDTLYISTARGLYAYDTNSTNLKWIYCTSTQTASANPCSDDEMPLGHSPTYYNGTIYVGGYDKKIHAIDGNNGTYKWSYAAEQGFDVNPLVVNDTVYSGNRDGYFYALDANSGAFKWKYQTAGPIHFSAAYKNNIVYFASNDMYAYALNAATGALVWKSNKLLGQGFYSYWPVVYTEPSTNKDYVIFGSSLSYQAGVLPLPAISAWGFNALEGDEIYPGRQNCSSSNAVSWQRGQEPGLWVAGTPTLNLSAPLPGSCGGTSVTNYFEQKPWRRTVFILDAVTGQEFTYDSNNNGFAEYAPFLWHGTYSGSRYPAIVGGDNVLYMATNYFNRAWIAAGQLAGWKWGTPYISLPTSVQNATDEPLSFSAGGNMIYSKLCCYREGVGFDLSKPNTTFPARDQWNREWHYFGYGFIQGLPEYKNEGLRFAAIAHGTDQNPFVPYKGKLYMIFYNSIFAFGPNGNLNFFANNPQPQTINPSFGTKFLGLNNIVSAADTSWPNIYQQTNYYMKVREFEKNPSFYSLAQVSTSDSAPVSMTQNTISSITTRITHSFGSNTLTTWVSKRAPGILFQATGDLYNILGDYTHIAYPAPSGIRILTGQGSFSGADMSESWILAWNNSNAPRFLPVLFSLQRRPNQITYSNAGVRMQFAGQAGYLTVTSFYGLANPKLLQAESWLSSLPSSIVLRAQTLNRLAKAFPETVNESWAEDPATFDVTQTYSYTYISVADDWNTPVLQVAYLPSEMALASWGNSPVRINNQPLSAQFDLDFTTPLGRVAGVADSNTATVVLPGLMRYWQEEKVPVPAPGDDPLVQKLTAEIDKILSAGHLKPAYVSNGIHFDNIGFFGQYFHNPAETIYTLLRALPYLPVERQAQVRAYLQNEYTNYPPYNIVHVGWQNGLTREDFNLPPEVQSSMANYGPKNNSVYSTLISWPGWNFPPYNFYALAKYAKEFNNASAAFAQISSKRETLQYIYRNYGLPYLLNSFISGEMGYLKLANASGVSVEALNTSKRELTRLLIERAALSKNPQSLADAGFEYGDYAITVDILDQADNEISFKKVQQAGHYFDAEPLPESIFMHFTIDFVNLVPELASFMKDYAQVEVAGQVRSYNLRAPYWFTSFGQDFSLEGTLNPLYDKWGYFQAKAQILGDSRFNLEKYLDIPALPRGDLYYIQNLVAVLEAGPANPLPLRGDLNNDAQVNVLDVQACVNHILGIQDLGNSADVNQDGSVDVLDVQNIVNIILGV